MKKSPYMNPDGTFKNGFDGCVLHMTNIEGHSQESAKRICGAIKQDTLANRHSPLLNRDGKMPTDGFYHAVPAGLSWNEEAGLWQLFDEKSLDAILNSFKPPLLCDQEHWSYDPSRTSEAMGWGVLAQKRADGIWVKIDLTDTGEPAVRNKRLLYLSPAFLPDDCEVVAKNIVRPLRLDTLALTNSANMKGLLKPLTNRSAETAEANHQPKGTPMIAKLITILGLAADAAESAVVEGVQALKNRAAALETSTTDLRKNNDALKTERDTLLTDQVERDLEEFKDVIANRDAMKKQLLANRAGTIELLKSLKAPAKPALHNRAGKTTPAAKTGAEKGGEQKIADDQHAATLAIKNRDKCDYQTARTIARQEKPELFPAPETEEAQS